MNKQYNKLALTTFLNNQLLITIAVMLFTLIPMAVLANTGEDADNKTSVNHDRQAVSPALGINHPPNRDERPKRSTPKNVDQPYRTFDGSYNNLDDPEMGATYTQLYRLALSDYGDGISSLAGDERPSAREVSNVIAEQIESIPNDLLATDFLWQWGQFLDHDIDLTEGTDPPEPAAITVPLGDIYFDPDNTGSETIPFNRSIYHEDSSGPRQQLNEITAWIDASNVYGSDEERARALRTLAGDGKLKTSEGDFLPFNDAGLPNAGGDSPRLFLAGDVRANEQVGLTAMHTLFVREHNRLAELIAQKHPKMSDEQIYQKARKLVGAEMQIITYREFLPALLGSNAISPYSGYKPTVNATITNSFSTAAYRFGHSALSPILLRLDETGAETAHGHLPLRDAFFNPSRITDEGGIEPLLRGLAAQICQTVDNQVIDDVRNFLFGDPGDGGFDLVSLNIQRGRDHGLPSYNDMRAELGFERADSFADISSNVDTQNRLAAVYDTVDDVDLWVGGLSENALPSSHLGPLFQAIIINQFQALRDGDRYWYKLTLDREEREMVEGLRLSDIIRLNTSIDAEIQDNVFRAVKSQSDQHKDRDRNSRKQQK